MVRKIIGVDTGEEVEGGSSDIVPLSKDNRFNLIMWASRVSFTCHPLNALTGLVPVRPPTGDARPTQLIYRSHWLTVAVSASMRFAAPSPDEHCCLTRTRAATVRVTGLMGRPVSATLTSPSWRCP